MGALPLAHTLLSVGCTCLGGARSVSINRVLLSVLLGALLDCPGPWGCAHAPGKTSTPCHLGACFSVRAPCCASGLCASGWRIRAGDARVLLRREWAHLEGTRSLVHTLSCTSELRAPRRGVRAEHARALLNMKCVRLGCVLFLVRAYWRSGTHSLVGIWRSYFSWFFYFLVPTIPK